MSVPNQAGEDKLSQPQKPTGLNELNICGWKVSSCESHILKSKCENEVECVDARNLCSVCLYNQQLDLPHIPDMVFPDNKLSILHEPSGFGIEFSALRALQRVDSGKRDVKIACAEEWKASRSDQPHIEHEAKPFDWTFTTDYKGTLFGGLEAESSHLHIDLEKLKRREQILFYSDITLFEDELHDNGTAICSVKIRVMPTGFFILLRYFLRVDNVLVRINDTRLYHEFGTAHIIREFSGRESKIEDLRVPTALLTDPNEINQLLPLKSSTCEILKLPSASSKPPPEVTPIDPNLNP
ncbi:TIP41-like protein [Frankliniella fusca]|uniref:TIP41-like protein n=1 Tax=Frankliniella fusca TaxID=407009 RepID=A0AAE1LNW3_9NEOP|nr:TIP41-like protein [Frankliniella fusca]